VIHTPVDLDRIPPSRRAAWAKGTPFRLVYLGGIGGRYLEHELFDFLAVAQRVLASLQVRIVTRVAPDLVRSGLVRAGVDLSAVQIGPADAADVGEILSSCDAGIFMLMEGHSNIATSATKIGEYWAAGLPVALTPNSGELDLLALEHAVGVVIKRLDQANYEQAFRELVDLASQSDIRLRCRAVASRFQGVEAVVDAQATIYNRILGKRTPRQTRT